MIPRIIHYCWFGDTPMNYMAKKCVQTFQSINNATIKEWNEQNVDLSHPNFIVSACRQKAWAFVSDYVRMKVLYAYGGIYLDTDIEIKKNFDDHFYEADMIISYMYDDAISAGIIMVKPHHPLIKKMLDYYEILTLDTNIPNNIYLTQQILEYYPGFRLDGKYREFAPKHFIYPKSFFHNPILLTGKGGYSVHHFMGSWHPKKDTLKSRLRPAVKYILFHCQILNWIYQNVNSRIWLKKMPHYQRYLKDLHYHSQ